MNHDLERDGSAFSLAEFELGAPVEVRRRFDQAWARGFEIAATDDAGYRLRRTSDGSLLPVVFPAVDVRPALPDGW